MGNLFCVIMAGGSEEQFWPKCKKGEIKPFVDILGSGKTLLRHTFERYSSIVEVQNFVIVTLKEHKETVLEIIPELKPTQVLCEPMRRNTATCISYAAYHIEAIEKDATMIVTPADHLIVEQNLFEDAVSKGVNYARKNNSLVTIGVTPTRAETSFGYIQAGESMSVDSVFDAKSFTEKPEKNLAALFCESGEFYWNSGIYIWRLSTFLKAIECYIPDTYSLFMRGRGVYNTKREQMIVDNIYPECKNISIDYGVIEKAENVVVVCADFGWSDIDSWNLLFAFSQKDGQNNALCSEQCHTPNSYNSIISVPKGKKVIVDGLEGYIVVDSGDSLLICPMDREEKVKEYLSKLE